MFQDEWEEFMIYADVLWNVAEWKPIFILKHAQIRTLVLLSPFRPEIFTTPEARKVCVVLKIIYIILGNWIKWTEVNCQIRHHHRPWEEFSTTLMMKEWRIFPHAFTPTFIIIINWTLDKYQSVTWGWEMEINPLQTPTVLNTNIFCITLVRLQTRRQHQLRWTVFAGQLRAVDKIILFESERNQRGQHRTGRYYNWFKLNKIYLK